MKSIAIFVHYSKDGKPNDNAMLYIKQLAKYFDQVVVSSNIFVPCETDNTISLKFDRNAYDFGYFYQALEAVGACDNYDIVGFFNDSNYIINSIEPAINWCFKSENNLCGITDCLGGRPELAILNQWHVQSHFLIFKHDAVKKLKTYLQSMDFEKYFEYNLHFTEMREQIIIHCEIMLSYVFRLTGTSIGAYFPAETVKKEYKSQMPAKENTHIWAWSELIEHGYPLIKRKIYDNSFPAVDRISINQNPLIRPIDTAKEVVKKHGNPEYINTL